MNFSMTDAKRTSIPSDGGHNTRYPTGSHPGAKLQERLQFSMRKFGLLCEAVQDREAKTADLPPGNVGVLYPRLKPFSPQSTDLPKYLISCLCLCALEPVVSFSSHLTHCMSGP